MILSSLVHALGNIGLTVIHMVLTLSLFSVLLQYNISNLTVQPFLEAQKWYLLVYSEPVPILDLTIQRLVLKGFFIWLFILYGELPSNQLFLNLNELVNVLVAQTLSLLQTHLKIQCVFLLGKFLTHLQVPLQSFLIFGIRSDNWQQPHNLIIEFQMEK